MPSCGARTTMRCRAAFSADCCASDGEVALDLALGRAGAQRQLAALGLQRGDLAQVGGTLALER